MTSTLISNRIALSRWYARVATGACGEADLARGARDAMRAGPLTIWRASEGCEVAWFADDRTSGVVVFDGYLFDTDLLARELGAAETSTSAHLAAAAYQRWGAGLFDHLDGCYLIAVWDAAAERLLLGHDALGRHPVFYAESDGAILFASNVLALASSGLVSTRPNRMSLALSTILYWPEAGRTFFESVKRVRPGHYLSVSAGGVAERKYWEPIPADEEPWLPDERVHAEFEPALMRAVERCMQLGAQGIFLSGGVDSVTVAALAAACRRSRGQPPLVAVSARTGGPLLGEEVMQSRVSEALGMRHVVSTTAEWKEGRDDVSLSLEMTPELPSPTHIWWVGAYTRFYRRTAGLGLDNLLTGAGGDNWLGVADGHAADLIRRLRLLALYRFMKADIVTGGASLRSSVRRLLWAGGLRPHLDSLWARMAPEPKLRYHRRKWEDRLPPWLCPDRALRSDLVEHLLARRTPALAHTGRRPSSYYRHSLRTLSNPYLHHESETAYHIETLCGLRLLSPYHDRRLVEFFNRISPRALVHGNRYKGLLRPVVQRHLPQLGLENQRKEYPADLQNRKLSDLRRSVQQAWPANAVRRLAELGIVDDSILARTAADWSRGGFEALARAFVLLSAERWIGTHGVP